MTGHLSRTLGGTGRDNTLIGCPGCPTVPMFQMSVTRAAYEILPASAFSANKGGVASRFQCSCPCFALGFPAVTRPPPSLATALAFSGQLMKLREGVHGWDQGDELLGHRRHAGLLKEWIDRHGGLTADMKTVKNGPELWAIIDPCPEEVF